MTEWNKNFTIDKVFGWGILLIGIVSIFSFGWWGSDISHRLNDVEHNAPATLDLRVTTIEKYIADAQPDRRARDERLRLVENNYSSIQQSVGNMQAQINQMQVTLSGIESTLREHKAELLPQNYTPYETTARNDKS